MPMSYRTLKLQPGVPIILAYNALVGYLGREQRSWGCSRKDRWGNVVSRVGDGAGVCPCSFRSPGQPLEAFGASPW